MYLLSFPRFWTLSIEGFWFLFWYVLNDVTLKTSNNMEIFWVYFTRVGDRWITGSTSLDYEQRVRYGQKIGMFASKKIEGHERKKIAWHRFFTEGWFPARAPYNAGVRGSRTTAEQLGRTREDFRRDHFIFRRTKGGGSVVTEITKNFGRIQRGDHSNLLGMKTWGREGITLAK